MSGHTLLYGIVFILLVENIPISGFLGVGKKIPIQQMANVDIFLSISFLL